MLIRNDVRNMILLHWGDPINPHRCVSAVTLPGGKPTDHSLTGHQYGDSCGSMSRTHRSLMNGSAPIKKGKPNTPFIVSETPNTLPS
jgi:hypothetical protein